MTCAQPQAAVLAVVTRGDTVLLVRRANPPDAGLWGFPGGKLETGETLAQGALRELAEETGLHATAGKILTALDVIRQDDAGHVQHHFVLIPVLCHAPRGQPVASDDAREAGWFTLAQVNRLPRSPDVTRLARQALSGD